MPDSTSTPGASVRQHRFASVSDTDPIAAMARDAVEPGMPWLWRRGRVTRAIRAFDTNVVVAERSGQLDGCGILTYFDAEAHLLLFTVRAACRRQGAGSALLRWLESVATASGARRIRLELQLGQVDELAFYIACGYCEEVIPRGMYEGPVKVVWLEKRLREE